MKVYIYALCNVYYDSFYIEGLFSVCKNVVFNVNQFPALKQGTFAFIVDNDGVQKRIIIDSRDAQDIDQEALNWCDCYGKINLSNNIESDKVIPIGPSFAVKIWKTPKAFYLAFKHLFLFFERIENKKEFIANYWRQQKRLPLSVYTSGKSSEDQVFFISSIWKNELKTNQFRSSFVKVCNGIKTVKFEGGFAPRKDANNLGFDLWLYPKRVSIKDYIEKTKNSCFVFNTPAVLSCHGWKLAEFLALGKTIISTPHLNKLPQDLRERIEVVYVENETDIKNVINELVLNQALRKSLEINSRNYYENNLAPNTVINKLIS